MAKNKVYLYLARLDRRGARVIACMPSRKTVYPTRLKDLNHLGMEPGLSARIAAEAHENRMTHELFIESAGSFEEWRESLRKRGYSNLPIQQFVSETRNSGLNESALVTDKSVMLQRSRR